MGAKLAPGSRRAKAAAETRDVILAAARQLFLEHGYEAVSLRQVAKAAGRSTGALFAHVADKADLFIKAMGRPAPNAASLRWIALTPAAAMTPDLQAQALTQAAQLVRDLWGKAAA